MFVKVNSFVDGRSLAPADGQYVDKIDPRTGAKISEVASSGPKDVALAIESAASALQSWRDMRPAERGRILNEFGRIILQSENTLGALEKADTGTPGSEMAALMDLTAQSF